VRYVDDRMRSRVNGMRLAIGFGVSSLVVAAIGPSVKAAGFPTLLIDAFHRRDVHRDRISFLPSERQNAMAALKPAGVKSPSIFPLLPIAGEEFEEGAIEK